MTSRGSISFDQAANFYDKTRGLSAEASAKTRDLLVGQLSGRNRALEVGVGTGRIALPLAQVGVPLAGIDISHKMLTRLIENAKGEAPFPIAQADATRLPFRDDSFGACIASWVFHLIPQWKEVAAEMVRVMESGGVLLVDVGGRDQGIWTDMVWAFRDAAGVDWPPGAEKQEEVDEAMAALGLTLRQLEPIIEVSEGRVEDSIAMLERGIFSVSFGLDEAVRKEAADKTREWARAEVGDLHELRRMEIVHTWRAYDC